MENIKYNKYEFSSCSTTGANTCVKLIMLSFRSKVYQSIVVLTLCTTQASALCFKPLMLFKENTWIRVLYKRQIFISHHYRRWEGIFLLSVAVCFKMFPSLRIFQRNKILCFYLVKRRREKSSIATLHSLMRRSTSFIQRRSHGLIISSGVFSIADKTKLWQEF